MICQKCQQRFAKIHFKQSINGKHKESYLCEICASNENQMQVNSQLMINDFLKGMISQIHLNSGAQVQSIQCNHCKMYFEQFQKSGRLGCAHCYEVFASKLAPIIRRLHGNVSYHNNIDKGQVYGGTAETPSNITEIQKLQKKLQEAVREENYELAAELRDAIKTLENTIKNQNP